jgi:CheY-like chemotaxis protein
MISNFGFTCDLVNDGEDAINKIVKKQSCKICNKVYRVLFIDINMPGMNGI